MQLGDVHQVQFDFIDIHMVWCLMFIIKILYVKKVYCFKLIASSFVFFLGFSYDERFITLQPSQRGGIILVKIGASKVTLMEI